MSDEPPVPPLPPLPIPIRRPSPLAVAEVPWRPVELDALAHVALGDVVDTLKATGFELRIEVRPRS